MAEIKGSIINQTDIIIPFSEEQFNRAITFIEEIEETEYSDVELAFVEEAEIVRINKEFLKKDYVTDVISFRLDENPSSKKDIEGNICACAPRIIEQAEELDLPVMQEFARVAIHGLLHFCGYEDYSDDLKQKMRDREDFYLVKLNLI